MAYLWHMEVPRLGAALEQHGHKPRDAGHHQRPEEAGYGTCSRAFGVGGIALLTP